MSRTRFRLADSDVSLAREWIDARRREGEIGSGQAYFQYSVALDAAKLQEWCDDNLAADQVKRMRWSIRRKRADRKTGIDRLTTTKMSRRARMVIKELSEKTNMTHSEVVLRFLEPLLCGGRVVCIDDSVRTCVSERVR